MKVITVDDHPVVRACLRAVLQSSPDIEVVEDFAHAEDAVNWLSTHDVDLVLMDLRFGRSRKYSDRKVKMDGAQAVRAIRVMDGPPVLVVTSYGSEPEVLGALAAGAAGYVLKDSSTDELLKAITAAIQGERFLGSGVSNRVKRGEGTHVPALTDRELDVLRLVAAGGSNAQIAQELHVSGATVKTHLSRVYDKLGARNRTAAVATARAQGILEQ